MQGDYETAEKHFTDLIAASVRGKEPQERLVTLVLWGAVLLSQGETEKAVEKLKEAAEGELYPMWQIVAYYYLGLTQEIQQNWEASQEFIQQT